MLFRSHSLLIMFVKLPSKKKKKKRIGRPAIYFFFFFFLIKVIKKFFFYLVRGEVKEGFSGSGGEGGD